LSAPLLREEEGVLWLGNVAFLPSIHGKVAFAREVRRLFLSRRFPTVAVELPESLAETTLAAIELLPRIHVVSYSEEDGTRCFFPIDPCDSIVEVLRLALGEHCTIEFIDLDVERFQRRDVVLPDSYALGAIGLARYYAAVEPALPRTEAGSQDDARERAMARRLFELERAGPRRVPVLCVLGMAHLRGVAAYLDAARRDGSPPEAEDAAAALPPFDVSCHAVSEPSLYHILGELPYTTHLYETLRGSITLDEFEAVDQLKNLLFEARERYHAKHGAEYERISLGSFQNLLQLVRNLCLLQKRLTPSLYEMAVGARGIAGSEFAIEVIETAKSYPPSRDARPDDGKPSEGSPEDAEDAEDAGDSFREAGGFSIEAADMTETAMRIGEEAVPAKKRYLDEAKEWKRLRLEPPPPPKEVERWRTAWNPFRTCSWTPEDVLIENFAGHVRSRALSECGIAQEHLEEFTTSFKDGIHIRETIRNLHLGKVIVKESPPVRGQVGAVIVIYEPPDPAKFPWKITWFPEYPWESILALYATDYRQDLVGPGIARAEYGGQLFLRAHEPIEDVWVDPELSDALDDAERLVFAGAQHSQDVYVAYVAARPPTHRMKTYAAARGKKILYLPLSSFSRSTLQKLRRFHVLNGKPVRDYARQYIR